MNEHEAKQVIGALTAAWPSHDMPDDTIRLWLGMLAPIERADAMAAAKVCVKEDMRFPPIARFLQVADERKHARLIRFATDRGIPEPPVIRLDPERLERRANALRAQIALRRGSGDHWHGGPDPCPVCGGIKDDPA